MRAVVIRDFADTRDRSDQFPNGYLYKIGDSYPRNEIAVDEERLSELSTRNNAAGEVFIKHKVKTNKSSKHKVEGKGDDNDEPTDAK